MYSLKNLSSALIYLYRSLCLICKQLHRGLSLKNSYSSIILCYPEIIYHFQSVICHLHIILEMLQSSHSLSCKYRLLQKSVYTICFDQLIKAYIPTPRCLHQSINGSLELAHFVSILWIDKTSRLHHIQLFFQKSIQECSLYIHLPNFIKCGNC